jgi:hypothetical protein
MDEYIIEEIYIFSVFLCAYLGYGGYEDAKGNVSGRYVAGLLGGAVGLGVSYVLASIFRFIA